MKVREKGKQTKLIELPVPGCARTACAVGEGMCFVNEGEFRAQVKSLTCLPGLPLYSPVRNPRLR